MPAKPAITRSTRLAGLPRLAARPRLRAAAGGAGADVRGVGIRSYDRLQRTEVCALRDRGGELGHACVEMQGDVQIGIRTFGAEVSLGVSPG